MCAEWGARSAIRSLLDVHHPSARCGQFYAGMCTLGGYSPTVAHPINHVNFRHTRGIPAHELLLSRTVFPGFKLDTGGERRIHFPLPGTGLFVISAPF